jgi:hypothetical protein
MQVKKKRRFLLRLVATCCLTGTTALLAQLQDGRIEGIVSDPQHAVGRWSNHHAS